MYLALVHAPLITPTGIVTDQPLVINTRTGRILSSDIASKATVVNLDGYMLYPGLVNAHDHLELNHFPRTRFREDYPNAHVWGEDVSAHLDEAPFRQLRDYTLWDRCFVGGLKNLLSGVTIVAHHNPLHRPLKSRKFPVRVVRRYGWAHSLHFETAARIQRSYQRTPTQAPWMIHLAEGTDDIAAREWGQLSDLGVVGSNTVLIHGVGMATTDVQTALAQGVGLVWCPSTNQYLLGKTTDVTQWAEAGKLALGSDSRLTADGDMLDELRAARATELLDDRTLFRLVTDNPRRILRLSDVGDLAPGMRADIIALPATDDPYQTFTTVRRADIALVMRGGSIQVGKPELVNRFPTGKFVFVELDGRPKLMAKPLVQQVRRCRIPNQLGVVEITR